MDDANDRVGRAAAPVAIAPMRYGSADGSDTRFNVAVLVAFIAVAAFGSVNHDMWRDEMQAWLIARDSTTPWDIVRNLRFEGHPVLWYLLIWPGSRLTWNPDAMKPVSVAVSTVGVALFLWRGPWSRVEKLLWPFGYYVLFEYTIKNRAYGVGVMLLMTFCALWPARRRRILAIALVLGLMANVHLYFGVLAATAALAIAVDRLARGGWRGLFPQPRRDVTALLIFVVLAGFAAVVAAPPANGDYSTPVSINPVSPLLGLGQITMPATMLLMYFHAPDPVIVVFAWIGVLTSVWSVMFFLTSNIRYPPPFIMLSVSVGIVLIIFRFIYAPDIQHAGMLLFAVVAAEWIWRCDVLERQSLTEWLSVRTSLRRIVFRTILSIQAAVALMLMGFHSASPYAHGRAVADYIRSRGWAEQPVAGLGVSLTPVCGYLRKPACFYVERSRWSSYMVFAGVPGMIYLADKTSPSELDRLAAAAAALGPAATFLVSEPWPDNPEIMGRHGFHKVASFTGATMDNYEVYRKDE